MLNSVVACAPAWSVLADLTRERAAALGGKLVVAGRRGTDNLAEGPPSAQSRLRTFGVEESKIRVIFYRDTHAWCPYCHKVWMQLEEKRIPYRVEKINMRCYGAKKPEFLAKVPQGLLPVLEVDGKVITESSAIMRAIEEMFPEHTPLMPRQSNKRQEAEQMLSLERDIFGRWLNWLRGEESERAKRGFENALGAVEAALRTGGGPFFLGEKFSLVDCVFASTLERIAATMLYYKGLRIRGSSWPHVDKWFSAMEARPSYRATQSDFHTHVHDLPPQIGGCIRSGGVEQLSAAAAIDGSDGQSWTLPLPPLDNKSIEPVPGGEEDPLADRIEAVCALVHHHAHIVTSSGTAVRAQSQGAVDDAYRMVVASLLEERDDAGKPCNPLKTGAVDASSAAALRYTRDRICVPRDMSGTAARQLRAHLNWVADAIDPGRAGSAVQINEGNRMDMDPARFWHQTL